MDRTTATPASKAPLFWECPSCGFLSSDPGFADAQTVCPECGVSGKAKRSFPPDRQRLLDERIRGYYRDGEWQITVILAAAMLEALLEDILDRIMATHGADIAIRGTLLDQVRTIGVRISRLFPDLTGVEFEAAAADLGYRDFPKRWRKVRQIRNAFIHDTPYRDIAGSLDETTAAEAMVLLDQAYSLFVSINNRFVADGRRQRGEVSHVSLHGEASEEDPPRGNVEP
jgi:rubredoxin